MNVVCWLFQLQRLFAQEQGNQAQLVFQILALWQMHRSAPLPKVGPKFWELKIAVFSSAKGNFCFRLREKRNDYFLMSEWIVLLVDFHAKWVNPPIILLNYVLTKTIVFFYPSQFWWNRLIEQSSSDALYNILESYIFLPKHFQIKVRSSLVLIICDPLNYSGFFILISLRSIILFVGFLYSCTLTVLSFLSDRWLVFFGVMGETGSVRNLFPSYPFVYSFMLDSWGLPTICGYFILSATSLSITTWQLQLYSIVLISAYIQAALTSKYSMNLPQAELTGNGSMANSFFVSPSTC